MPSGNTLGESTETPGDMIIEENVEMDDDDTETESFEDDSESEIRINRNNLGNFRKFPKLRSKANFQPRAYDAFLAMPNWACPEPGDTYLRSVSLAWFGFW